MKAVWVLVLTLLAVGSNAQSMQPETITDFGSGWVKFWWFDKRTEWPAGETDVLRSAFGACSQYDTYCFGRIAASVPQDGTELLARSVAANGKTVVKRWVFSSINSISNAVFGSLRDQTRVRLNGGDVWNPVQSSANAAAQNTQDAWEYELENGVYGFQLDDDTGYCHTSLAAGATDATHLGVDVLDNACTGNGDQEIDGNGVDRSLELWFRPPSTLATYEQPASEAVTDFGDQWHKFWWFYPQSSWPAGEVDTLERGYGLCDPSADYCFGRLPGGIVQDGTELLARTTDELGKTVVYRWEFDSTNSVSSAVFNSLLHGTRATLLNGDAWEPAQKTANAAAQGGQDSWKYQVEFGIAGFQLDDDNGYCHTSLAAGAVSATHLGVGVLDEHCTGGSDPNTDGNRVDRTFEMWVRTPAMTQVAQSAPETIAEFGTNWQRFWWFDKMAAWPASETDVINRPYGTCDPSDTYCFGRLPTDMEQDGGELLARTVSPEGTVVVMRWEFDSSNAISDAVFNAFQNRVRSSLRDSPAWNPVQTTSNGNEAGMRDQDSWKYIDSFGVVSFILDDDNAYCFNTITAGESPDGYFGVDVLDNLCEPPSGNPSVDGNDVDVSLELFFRTSTAGATLACTGDVEDDGYYYTPTTSVLGCDTDNNANNCFYGIDSLATEYPASLRVDLSELKADGGTDYIYLAFDMPSKYYNSELVFADATANECEFADWELVSYTAPGVQTLNEGCFTTFVYRLPWTDAYSAAGDKCGWERDTSGANVKLTLDFAVRAEELLGAMRNGTTITRKSEFSMPVQVEFPVQVVADADNVQVFAPVRVIAAIVGQSVTIDESTNPDTATLTLRLSTEVQKPFELHAITSESHPGDITLATTLDGGNDANVRKDAECTDSAVDCGNEWEWTYTTQTTTEPCDFDGAYSVSFTVRCSDENDTDCPIDDATDSVTVTFNVDSSDHCPKVVDSIVLSSDLYVFDAPQRVTAADDFVGDGLEDDGQTAVNEGDADQWQVAYFTAPTTSTQVALDTTEFNQVWIVRDDDSKVVLLDKDNTHGTGAITCTATAYADADNTASCGTEAGLDSTTCQLIVPDVTFPDKCGAFDFAHRPGTAADAGDDSIPWFEFDINTGASGFNMDDDAIETLTVHAVIDVTYTNAAKLEAGSAQETRTDFATVSASLNAAPSTSTSGTSTGTSSSALFGMNATVLYGAGAFLALAVLAVLVVVSRRRSSPKLTKLQSTTELTTSV